MKQIRYDKLEQHELFKTVLDEENKMLILSNPTDQYDMNWAKGMKAWGTVKCEHNLTVEVNRQFTERDTLRETYSFRNDTDFDIHVLGTQVGIYTTFPDNYQEANICMTNRCHAHIWCGGANSYIMALRMGGEAPHLGLILTEGSLKGYSIERDETASSNQRGDFILHPDNFQLKPGDSYEVSWEIFWFRDRTHFKEITQNYEGHLEIKANNFTVFQGEDISFEIKLCKQKELPEEFSIHREGKEVPFEWKQGTVYVKEQTEKTGEYKYDIVWKNQHSKAVFLILPELKKLIDKRCSFITQYQQYHDPKSHLDGAYIIYDNEEKCQYYSAQYDHNGGRERVGMGVLLATYLQCEYVPEWKESLDNYIEYVKRELFDVETGVVYNDRNRSMDIHRLYNYPWVSVFFMELYKLEKNKEYLLWCYRAIKAFYSEGGKDFYAIGIPMYESISLLKKVDMKEEAEELLAYYKEHGEFIRTCGKNYPAHEVKYEQSIVAPAAAYMRDLYLLTGETEYKIAAREQLEILDLFQSDQPDYHLFETAIRHWDGFWFGKRQSYGDTFPHYWSGLSGRAYMNTKDVVETEYYENKAEANIRGTLSLFKEDGSASCAMVFPLSVNGQKGNYYDPWANDQDWGLYFMLRYHLLK